MQKFVKTKNYGLLLVLTVEPVDAEVTLEFENKTRKEVCRYYTGKVRLHKCGENVPDMGTIGETGSVDDRAIDYLVSISQQHGLEMAEDIENAIAIFSLSDRRAKLLGRFAREIQKQNKLAENRAIGNQIMLRARRQDPPQDSAIVSVNTNGKVPVAN